MFNGVQVPVEMMGDHAIYNDGWIASTKVIRPPWEVIGPVNQDPFNKVTWELYDLSKDWTQSDDVAAANPEKLKDLKELFLQEARKYDVLPLDATVATRLVAPRPNITAGRSVFTYTKPLTGIPQGDSPIPLIMQWDETFDIGSDTGTPVDDQDYQVPFKFTGKLSKLTLRLDRPQLTPVDQKRLLEAERNNKMSE